MTKVCIVNSLTYSKTLPLSLISGRLRIIQPLHWTTIHFVFLVLYRIKCSFAKLSQIVNISLRAWLLGDITTISSAHDKLFKALLPIQHPRLDWFSSTLSESQNTLYKKGLDNAPWRIPFVIWNLWERIPFHRTLKLWLLYQNAKILTRAAGTPCFNNLVNNFQYDTLSKAERTSMKQIKTGVFKLFYMLIHSFKVKIHIQYRCVQ